MPRAPQLGGMGVQTGGGQSQDGPCTRGSCHSRGRQVLQGRGVFLGSRSHPPYLSQAAQRSSTLSPQSLSFCCPPSSRGPEGPWLSPVQEGSAACSHGRRRPTGPLLWGSWLRRSCPLQPNLLGLHSRAPPQGSAPCPSFRSSPAKGGPALPHESPEASRGRGMAGGGTPWARGGLWLLEGQEEDPGWGRAPGQQAGFVEAFLLRGGGRLLTCF